MKNLFRLTYCLQLIMTCLLCWGVGGCVSTKYIERKQYLLETPKNITKKTIPIRSCLVFVKSVTAYPPFDRVDFLYRVTSERYLADYYNVFLVPPAEQLDVMLRKYLGDCEVFNNILQVKLTELYADYRNPNNPQAIIALQFVLTKQVGNKQELCLNRIFRSHITLKEKNTISLLHAWNTGTRNIFAQVLPILNRVLKEPK